MASELIIKISAESKEFSDAIKDVGKQTEELESQLAGVAKASGAIFAGLVASAGFAIHAFGDAEKASKALEVSLLNQGLAGSKLAAKYNDIADAIQEKTGVDNDAIIAGTALLQNFLGQTEASEELIAAMTDLAEKTGSTESAAEILGKGIAGNVKAFKQFGIEIDATGSKEERIAEITEKVTQKFGGLAAKGNEGVGSVRGLQTAFGNVIEQVGKRLAPTFEAMVGTLTQFFQRLEKNAPLLDFIVESGKTVAIIAGVVLSLTTASLAIIKLQQAFQIASAAAKVFGLSTKLALGPLGILLFVVGEIFANWETVWPAMVAIYQTFAKNISKISGGLGSIIDGVFHFDPAKIKAGYDQLAAITAEGVKKVQQSGKSAAGEDDADVIARKNALAAKQQQEEARIDQLRTAQAKEQHNLRVLQQQQASDEVVDLKKQEIEVLKALEESKDAEEQQRLKDRLDIVRTLEADAQVQSAEQRKIYQEQVLLDDENFQNLSAQQQLIFQETEQRNLQNSILTRSQAQQKFVADQQKMRIESNNLALIEEQKYGEVYAKLHQNLNKEEVQGVANATSQLVSLQNSKSAELRAIGKAAAIADITIKTAQSAMAIFAGFSVIPFIGPALGVAGAAAAIAYGAEQIGTVLSAQSGGIVPGFNTGGDSVPSLLQPGELVVPRANFSEVVNAVASAKANEAPEASSIPPPAAGTQQVSVSLQFSGDNAEKFLTARQVESRSLGTLRESGAVA